MGLARVWARQISGASFAALLAPVAVIASLAALGVAGGFGRIGSIAQVFTGPAVPDGAAAVRSASARPLPNGRIAQFPRGGAARTRLVAAPVRRVSGAPALQRKGSEGRSSRPGTSGGGTAGGGGRGGGGGTGGGPPTQPTPPTPRPTPTTLTDRVISVATSVTDQLPAPVGGLATGVLKGAGSSADQLLGDSGGSANSGGSNSSGTTASGTGSTGTGGSASSRSGGSASGAKSLLGGVLP